MTPLLGIDTGGTFTDFVLLDEQGLRTHKVLSTPDAPEKAILQGIQDLGISLDNASITHGSTVATNAVLERKGVETAYITNHGLADVVLIGRQARKELYNLQPQAQPSIIRSEMCFETGGRIGANGEIVSELSDDELDTLYQQIQAAKPQAIAVNLLFSFLDPQFEQRIVEKLKGLGFVCASSEVLPEYKEYERGMATLLNAYVGPLMQGYLQRLQQQTYPARLSIMQSYGGTINAEHAAKYSVNLLLSGPAGGLRAAQFVGKHSGNDQLLTFDMGGTSTDVALIDKQIRLTNEGKISDLPVAVPMVDMHTIGAGGGSIAWLDQGGMLQVGPQSAGASPGPACYGKGGTLPTVTDANLVLGRLHSTAFLGGNMQLDVAAARTAMRGLAEQLACSIEELAQGIIRIANEHMAQALRVISVQRGMDPRHYVLTSFGGAGGLHVCELADNLGLQRALVPIHGGVLSALGMLVSPHSREYSKTVTSATQAIQQDDHESLFQELEQRGREALLTEGIATEDIALKRELDLRYLGQSYTITIPWNGLAESKGDFHATHEQRFGHRLNEPVEVVNLRVKASGPQPEIKLPVIVRKNNEIKAGSCNIYGIAQSVPVYQRNNLCANQSITGPALITEMVSTTYIAEQWQCRVDEYGNLGLEKL
jgi:N-methylhydantoinase A